MAVGLGVEPRRAAGATSVVADSAIPALLSATRGVSVLGAGGVASASGPAAWLRVSAGGIGGASGVCNSGRATNTPISRAAVEVVAAR